ncbi:hypothetical protein EZV62_023288 [Acer yangbiense]|uniref:Reverse transcriptase zinc-binding domain-containing protein n=1 Tax=Acer yangbiense TaxID=1000413 RepID=A0A5C7H1A9_9ROSI|nr:hypothetical protein EZV62_023288 [Acer yangbiense]
MKLRDLRGELRRLYDKVGSVGGGEEINAVEQKIDKKLFCSFKPTVESILKVTAAVDVNISIDMNRGLLRKFTADEVPSCVWRGIFWGREVLLRGIRCRIGDGRNIAVYKDSWMPRPGGFRVYSPKCLHENAMVSELMEQQGRWDQGLVRSCFLGDEVELILSIPLSINHREDAYLWHFDKKGKFSIKSAYKVALADQLNDQASCSYGLLTWWKKLWSLELPSKIRIFYWKACKEILPTMLLLYKRGMVVSDLCPFCGDEPESVDHALWRVLWLSLLGNKDVLMHFLVTAWLLWFRRNRLLHGGTVPVNDSCWDQASEMLKVFENSDKIAPSLLTAETKMSVAAAPRHCPRHRVTLLRRCCRERKEEKTAAVRNRLAPPSLP